MSICHKSDIFREYQTALRYYCRLACRLSSLSFENMLLVVLEFAQDGKNVAQHPCYPKVPVSVYVRFCRKNGYNLLEKMPPALLEQYHKKDNPVVKKLEQEFFDDRHDFCERVSSSYGCLSTPLRLSTPIIYLLS